MASSFLPPKGMRDFNVDVQILRQKVFSIIEKTFQSFGFEPIETPIVERWEILSGKYGEEAENRLIWRFKLPYSDKEFGLRYDLTIPLARFIARFTPKLPFKRYQIGRVYRYDDPQKGRYREFWQADVDIVGSSSLLADSEIIDVIAKTLENLGFSDFTVKINDRQLLFALFQDYLKIEENKILPVFRVIDKLDKIGKDGVVSELSKILEKDKVQEISRILEEGNDLQSLANFDNKKIGNSIKNLQEIIEFSQYSDKIKFDISLVRGLDYYTSTIFEVILNNINIGSIAGGGRYDNLMGLFINQSIPAVGGSLGVERIIDAGIELKIFKLDQKTIANFGMIYVKETVKEALNVANLARNMGITTFMSPEPYETILDGIRDLSKRGIKYAIIIGREEVSKNKVIIQNLETREKEEVAMVNIKEKLESFL